MNLLCEKRKLSICNTHIRWCVCISRNGKLLHRIMSRRWHRRKHIILHTFITRIYISFSIRWIQKVASFNRRKIYLIFGDAHVLYAIRMEFCCGYHKFCSISVTHFCCFVHATAAVAVKLLHHSKRI